MIGTAVRNTALAALECILIAASALNEGGFSTAAYTSQSSNAVSTASAAVDWTPPTVSLTDPGAMLKGSVTVVANATDADTGVAGVTLQMQATGAAAWTPLCTATAAPYRCTWNTAAVADGPYDLRAVATDRSGNSAVSTVVRTFVGNSFGVTLADPGQVLRGPVNLTANLRNASALAIYTIRFEYSAAGTGQWSTAASCTSFLSASGCSASWQTTSIASGVYDLRTTATPLLGSTVYSPVVSGVIVDNTPPVVTMTDPGTPLSGTVTLAASAVDPHSGIASVVIQYAPNGTSSWTTACTITQAPYSCRFATTSLPRGMYSFRAIATDVGGNTATSAVVSNRRIDETTAKAAAMSTGTTLTAPATEPAPATPTPTVAPADAQEEGF